MNVKLKDTSPRKTTSKFKEIDLFPDTDTIMNFCRENEARGQTLKKRLMFLRFS